MSEFEKSVVEEAKKQTEHLRSIRSTLNVSFVMACIAFGIIFVG